MMGATDITISYATTDDDVITIHRFLCVVAGPMLPGPIDPADSTHEVWRVAREDVALMALQGEKMVGTIGIVRPTHWWNQKLPFLANRWAFVIPGIKAWRPLLKEARAIAVASDLEFRLFSEERGKITIFNRKRPVTPALAKAG